MMTRASRPRIPVLIVGAGLPALLPRPYLRGAVFPACLLNGAPGRPSIRGRGGSIPVAWNCCAAFLALRRSWPLLAGPEAMILAS
jgi:hypothetical protein